MIYLRLGNEWRVLILCEAEADARNELFWGQFLHFDHIFSKTKFFGRFSTGIQKFRLKTGFNMGTLLVNPLKRPATPLDAGYTASVFTHWIENAISYQCTSTALQKLRGHEAKLDEAEATTVTRSRPEITRPRPVFGPRSRGRDEDLTSLLRTSVLQISQAAQ